MCRAKGMHAWPAGVHADTKAEPFASPEELLDALASLRAELSRRRPTERAARATKRAIEQLITARCPPAWQAQPALQSALAGAWRDLKLRRPGMDVPIALGLGAAFAGSAWATFTGGGAALL